MILADGHMIGSRYSGLRRNRSICYCSYSVHKNANCQNDRSGGESLSPCSATNSILGDDNAGAAFYPKDIDDSGRRKEGRKKSLDWPGAHEEAVVMASPSKPLGGKYMPTALIALLWFIVLAIRCRASLA